MRIAAIPAGLCDFKILSEQKLTPMSRRTFTAWDREISPMIVVTLGALFTPLLISLLGLLVVIGVALLVVSRAMASADRNSRPRALLIPVTVRVEHRERHPSSYDGDASMSSRAPPTCHRSPSDKSPNLGAEHSQE